MRKIKKIYFYTDGVHQNASILYSDGTMFETTKDEGVSYVIKYIKQEHISIKDPKIKENVIYMSKDEFLKKININKDRNENKLQTKDKTSKQQVNTIEEYPKKHRKIKKVMLYAIICSIALTNVKLDKKGSIAKLGQIIASESNQDSNINLVKKPQEYNILEVLQSKNINAKKRKIFATLNDYLYEYNQEIGQSHKTKKAKLAHTVDEAKAQYLLFNNIGNDEVNSTFTQDEFNVDKLKEDYKKSLKQNILFHIVEVSSAYQAYIINSKKGVEFYHKYERILLAFNRVDKKNIKIKYANQFFNMLRNDFKNRNTITSYELSIREMVEAMQLMCAHQEKIHSLNKKEYKKLEKLFNDKVNEKIEKYKKYKIPVISNEDISYTDYEKSNIKKLKENDSYYTKEKDRNIAKTNIFKKHVMWQFGDNKSNSRKKLQKIKKLVKSIGTKKV